MRVLGISCFYHDAAAALVVDGELVAAAEEERFSRIKHDFEFPEKAVRFCLERAGLAAGDLDLVVFYEKPFLKFDRILMSALHTFPRSLAAFREGMLVWLLDKLWVRDITVERLGVERDRIVFCPHHLSHAASAFYSSGFDRSAVLTVDGVGEWATGTRGVAWDSTIELQDQMSYPHSIGLLYSAFTAFLGFQVNEGEYKVMGMAPYGQPRFVDTIFKHLVHLHDDGSFWLDMSYFAFHHSADRSFSNRFCDLFGRPRTPAESNLLDPHYADIAASIQKAAEEILVRQARSLHNRTGHDNLVMAGGVALNSVANSRILRESGFRSLYIQPAAGDGGGALGAALWGSYEVGGVPRRFRMRHAYWGQEHSDADVADFLRGQDHAFTEHDDEEALYDEVVSRLTAGQVVGWMQGRFEWGPRALGHRSILADPRPARMKDVVNARIKFREPFRPFAPSVLAERVEDFFVLPGATEVEPARFMLLVVPVLEERQPSLGAITHVDGTARIQAVHRAESPRYHRLIEKFGEATGVPVVLNTSFNLRGEPIVNTPAEAFSTYARSDMDALVMGRFVVSRRSAAEQRSFSGADLEKWSHQPTLAPTGEARPAEEASQPRAVGGPDLFGAKPAEEAGEPAARKTVAGAIGTALLVLLVCLLGAEIMLRFWLPNPNLQLRGLYRQERGNVSLTPNWHGRVRTHEFDTLIDIDGVGLRDPHPTPMPDRKHLLVLGDSFTFGCWSDQARTFVSQLEQELGTGVQAISAGQPNFGTDGALELLRRRGDDFKPDAVLLAFYTGNDFSDNMIGLPAYEVEGGHLVMADEWAQRLEAYNCASQASATPVPLEVGPYAPAQTVLTSPLPAAPGARAAEGRQQAGIMAWPSSLAHGLRALARRTYLYQFVAAARHSRVPPGVLRVNETAAWFLKTYPPEMRTAVEMTFRYLDGILAECRRRQVPMALVVIPSALEVYADDWQAWLKTRSDLPPEWFDRERPRKLVEAWARARGVPMCDLAPELARRSARLYYQRDMHWSDAGHFLAGVKAGEFLKKEGILVRP